MGLQIEPGLANYLTIMEGKIIQRVEKDTENAEKRINKLGKTVYELKYDSLVGIIADIKIDEHEEYGKFWNITIRDIDEVFVLQIPYNSGNASGFLKRIESVDLNQPVKFRPYYIEDDGKFKAHLVLYQGGNKIESNYTKDNPNGLPPLEQKTVNNRVVWDSTEQMTYFENIINEKIRPKLGTGEKGGLKNEDPGEYSTEDAPEKLDDLPF